MIYVVAWGKEIGKLIEDKGIIKFKYNNDNFLEFSPMKMPVAKREAFSFSNLSYQYGLPGLISDHLPGSYGMNYMDKFIYQHLNRKPTIMEKLQFLGSHTFGALEFHPASNSVNDYKEILDASKLYKESKELLESKNKSKNSSQPTLKTLIAISNSAGGGARAKAMVGFNPKDKTISLTRKQGNFPDGFYPVIIKYDDRNISMYPGLAKEYQNASVPTKLEYLYYLFAKEAGVSISQCELLESDGRSHFLTYRFDRRDNERFHMHSLSGMMHYNPEETYNDYLSMLQIAQKLNLSQKNKEQIVKLLLFNGIFGNRDDHSRNFSFLMNKEGKWAFAPAYDLTYSSNGYHQMLLGSVSLNRATYSQLRDAFVPYNISESFIKETIKAMIDIKHSRLLHESINYGIPKSFANNILEETKIVDEMYSKDL